MHVNQRGNVRSFLFLAWVLFLASTMPARALDTTGWCSTVAGSPVVMCEDFDDYCADPPCDDAIGSDIPDQSMLLAVWPSDGCLKSDGATPSVMEVIGESVCGDGAVLQCAASTPFSGRQWKGEFYPFAQDNQYLADGTSHRMNMVPRIQELDAAKGSVNGTDENPLTLEFVLDLPGDSTKRFAAAQTNRYIELTDGSDRAPVVVELVACDETKIRPKAPVDDGLDHNAIALGMLALIDADGPCTPEQRPLTYRLALYNGDRWFQLGPPAAPGVTYTGDGLKVGGHLNYVKMIIKSGVLEVQLGSTVSGVPVTETATVTRVYTGGFAAMHVGNEACVASPKDVGNNYVDNIALHGGTLEPPIPTGACCLADTTCVEPTTSAGCVNRYAGTYAGDNVDCAAANCPAPIGACCRPNGQCVETTREDCENNLGGRFQGDFTACTPEIICCADPFADADGDGDVDQTDFAVVQACFTGPGPFTLDGPCRCFDRDAEGVGDNDVDGDDYGAFEECASGPGIPADPSCG